MTLKGVLAYLWDRVVRLRTWLWNLVLAIAFVLPDLLNAPEFQAAFPPLYQKYVLVAALLVNLWLRPRLAARKADK